VISAGIWTFVVGFAVLLLALEWRAHRRSRPSVLAPAAVATSIEGR
jgi:hypothetical protein